MQRREVGDEYSNNACQVGDEESDAESQVFSLSFEVRVTETYKSCVRNDAKRGERTKKGRGMRDAAQHNSI